MLYRPEANTECCSSVSASLVYEIGSLPGLELTYQVRLLASEPKEPPASSSQVLELQGISIPAFHTDTGDRMLVSSLLEGILHTKLSNSPDSYIRTIHLRYFILVQNNKLCKT